MKLPTIADADDRAIVGRLLLYSVAVLVVALVGGLCVRVFLWAAFAG